MREADRYRAWRDSPIDIIMTANVEQNNLLLGDLKGEGDAIGVRDTDRVVPCQFALEWMEMKLGVKGIVL